MILSAGLTPAWQHILVFGRVHPGEVNRAEQVCWCASGKVFNAGIAAAQLGGPSRVLAAVGREVLPQIERQLAELSVGFRWVVTKASTRVCTTVIERSTGTVTELVENAMPLSDDEHAQFLQAFEQEAGGAKAVILIGSLPEGTPPEFYRCLMEKCPAPVVADFRGPGLLAVLDLEPMFVKPNRQELARTIDRPINDDRSLVQAMRQLNDRGAQWVVVSQGPGPVWVSSARQLYRCQPPRAQQVVNPIGCGDAMAGALAWAVARQWEPLEAVRLAIAAAAENLRGLLPCRLDPGKVFPLAEKVEVVSVP